MTMTTAATDVTTDDLDVPSVTARHFGLAVVALAMGGFAIGTTEFVTMGLLPQISSGVDVSIPTGGHVISAYAVGVVVGAPLLAFLGARLPRRALSAPLVRHEADWLPQLAPTLPVQVPTPVAVGEPGRGYPWTWLVCPWFAGRPLTDVAVEDRTRVAAALGGFGAGCRGFLRFCEFGR